MEPLQTGALQEERYRVEAVVGAGPHDVLYRVSDPRFATDWLMREMDVGRLDASRRAAAIQAFQEEAAALAELRHPGLAQVVGHFVHPDDPGGPRAYVLTEWVDGASLRDRVNEAGGGLPLDEVADLGAKVLDALYFLHTGETPRVLGVLAPDGVWVSRDSETKLVDLGLSRHFDPQATPAASAPLDLAVDVRAAGALLYFMAMGRMPDSEAGRPDLPRALGDVIEKALAAGYPDAGELKHDLMAVAEGFAPEASPSAGAVASTAIARPAQAASERRKGCGSTAAVLLIAGVLAMLFV